MAKTSKVKHLWIAIIGLLMITGTCLMLSEFDEEQLFPDLKQSNFIYDSYHEELDTNWSSSNLKIHKDSLVLQYQLSEARHDPFVAQYFETNNEESFNIDIKNFSSIRIDLRCEKATRIPVILKMRFLKFEKESKDHSEVPFTTIINYQKEGAYELRLEDFEIPSWWLRFHGVTKEEINIKELNDLRYFVLGSCQALAPGIEDVIVLKKVTFFSNNETILFTGGSALLAFIIVLYILHLKGQKKVITVAPVVIKSKEENDQAVLVGNYIGEHFSNPDLSVYSLRRDLRIPPKKISKIFKEDFNSSFKIYLNTVRLLEVKRLLEVSDKSVSISDIAKQCGYSSIPHFNRLFKAETGMTPKAYREQ